MSGHLGLVVQHAALEQIRDDLRRAVLAIHDRMARLDGELAPLRADFDGQARASYDTSKAAWDTAIHEMRQLLDHVSRQVGEANAEFARVDAQAAARIGQVF
jgi:early secretory antigenic target protein ESAT-6